LANSYGCFIFSCCNGDIVRDIIIWSPDFVVEFFFNSEINAQKVSLGAIAFGAFMVTLGFGKKNIQAR